MAEPRHARPASTASRPCCCRSASSPAPTRSQVVDAVKERLAEVEAARCRPATTSASSATCRSSSRPRSTASRSTSSSARSSPRSSCCSSSATGARRSSPRSRSRPRSSRPSALIWYMGFTLNSMTMLALTLAVGIVIDDAIVVLENIYRFIEEKGMAAVAGGGRGDAGDRPRRAGDDAVAGRDLRAGRLHGRHRRPLHDELRPHDGVRDHGVAARQLHADADAGGALDQDEAAARGREGHAIGTDSKDSRIFRRARSRLHAHARLVAGAPRRSSPASPCSCC